MVNGGNGEVSHNNMLDDATFLYQYQYSIR